MRKLITFTTIFPLLCIGILGFIFSQNNSENISVSTPYSKPILNDESLGVTVKPYCDIHSKLIIYSSNGIEEIMPDLTPVSTQGLPITREG